MQSVEDIPYKVIKNLETDGENIVTNETEFITIPAGTICINSGKDGKIIIFKCSFDNNTYTNIILEHSLLTTANDGPYIRKQPIEVQMTADSPGIGGRRLQKRSTKRYRKQTKRRRSKQTKRRFRRKN